MDIATATSPLTQSGTPAAPGTSTRAIASDYETFLRMLTVQMKNQDPLNPVDSSDYAVQLATFSGVEQQVQTNDLLRALTQQMLSGGLSDMASWVGKEARAAIAAPFDGSPLTIVPQPVQGASRASLVVTRADGVEMQRLDIPISGGPIEWAGVGPSGGPLPAGNYRFDVLSYQGDVLMGSRQAEVYSRVREVRIEGGQTMLVFGGGASIPAKDVVALRAGNGG